MRRVPWLGLSGCVGLVVGLGCACGGPECPEGERVQYDGCVPDDCGDYPFGDFSGGDFVFVKAGAEEGGDGTEDAPFASLAEGVERAVSSGRAPLVVVSSGTYEERLLLGERHDRLRIEGVCRRDVVIAPPDDLPAFDLEGGAETEVRLSQLTVRNGDGPGVVVGRGQIFLGGVDVDGSLAVGVAAFGGQTRLELLDVSISRTALLGGADSGYGLAIGDGAIATASGVQIRDSGVAGVLVDGPGSALWLGSSSIEGFPDEIEGIGRGAGILVSNSASAELIDTRIHHSRGTAVAVSNAAVLTASDVSVYGVRPGEAAGGTAVSAVSGARIEAVGLEVSGAALYGLAASGTGTVVVLDGGRIGDGLPDPVEPSAGIGLVAASGATIEASGLLLEANRVYGAVVSGERAVLDLDGVEVADTSPSEAMPWGGGLLVQQGGLLLAHDLAVSGTVPVGILVDGEGSRAELDGAEVGGTGRSGEVTAGAGVAVQDGASLSADGLVVTDTEGPGLLVADAEASCAGCRLSRNAFAGLVAVDAAEIAWSDGRIVDTIPDANLSGGVGAFAVAPASLSLEGAVLTGNARAAVVASGDAAVSLVGNLLVGGAQSGGPWPDGTAVFASGTTAQGLWLGDNDLNDSAGAGLFLDGGTASLGGNRYSGNAIDVIQQLCGGDLPPPEGLDSEPVSAVELCPEIDRPVSSFAFSTRYQPIELAE